MQQGNKTGYQVTNLIVRSDLEIARYKKIHIRHIALISSKLQYLATL